MVLILRGIKMDRKNQKDENLARIKRIWNGMIARCYNNKNASYKIYGGRGIIVCNEWQEFEKFYNWTLNNSYADNLSIDRIDNNGNYEPTNCRWITLKAQSRNRRKSAFIEYNGQIKCASEWAELYSLDRNLVLKRIRRGWGIHEALTTPKTPVGGKTPRRKAAYNAKLCSRKPRIIEYNGEKLTYAQWAEKLGINCNMLKHRINTGWSLERALSGLPTKTNKHGYKNVTLNYKKYRGSFSINKKMYYTQSYLAPKEAHEALLELKNLY